MIYYFVESALISIFITLAWKFFLEPTFNFHIGYFQWLAMIWIVKVIFFDVFKLLSNIVMIPPQNDNNETTNIEDK